MNQVEPCFYPHLGPFCGRTITGRTISLASAFISLLRLIVLPAIVLPKFLFAEIVLPVIVLQNILPVECWKLSVESSAIYQFKKTISHFLLKVKESLDSDIRFGNGFIGDLHYLTDPVLIGEPDPYVSPPSSLQVFPDHL